MTEIRAGGHVIGDHGWEPADLAQPEPVEEVEPVEEEEPALSMLNSKDELLEAADAAGVDVDETFTKAEILDALEA